MITETLQIVARKTPKWMRWAQCADADPDLFYPEPGEDNTPKVKAAVRICRTCPVRGACLRWAFETEREGYRWGILGGKTANQRTRIANRVRNLNAA